MSDDEEDPVRRGSGGLSGPTPSVEEDIVVEDVAGATQRSRLRRNASHSGGDDEEHDAGSEDDSMDDFIEDDEETQQQKCSKVRDSTPHTAFRTS